MLEDRCCFISRGFLGTCEHKNCWAQPNFGLRKIEVQSGKRPLQTDGDKEVGVRKLSKQSDAHERVDLTLTLQGAFLSLANYSNNQHLPPADQSCNNHPHLEDQSGNLCQPLEEECRNQPLPLENQSNDQYPVPVEQSSYQRQATDYSDSSSLINSIGTDISINCLIRCSRSDYGSIASLNRSFHSLIRSGELYKLRLKSGVVEHWVYFSCQHLEWEAFDPARCRWLHLPKMTFNEYYVHSDKESLAVGTELLVFTKEMMSHVIYRYSLLTNTWSIGMMMNEPRCLFGSASLEEIAILAGGCDSQGNILSSAEFYNSESGTWVTLPNMNKPRKMCSGVFMDNKFYVIGGIGGSDSKLLTCGEEYNMETRTWREIPNMSPVDTGAVRDSGMPTASDAPPLVAVVNNELYAADYADMQLRKYEKERRIWTTMGRLPECAVSMNGWGLAFKACGDRVIVIGGPRGMCDGYIEVNSWVPSEGPPQWNLLGRKQSGSFVFNCAVMGC